MKKELDRNKHSVFLLYFHLVLVVKYRRKAIDDEISEFLKSEFSRLGDSHGIMIMTTGGVPTQTIRRYIQSQRQQ